MKRRYVVLMLCLLAVAGAWLFWPHGSRSSNGRVATNAGGQAAATANTLAASAAGKVTAASILATNKLAFRLANTTNSLQRLIAAPHAILLANALIDTEAPLDLKIPDQLKAKGDPGAYIVQARGVVNARFRLALSGAGAKIISYIPNNAYLVQLSAGAAGSLAANAAVQAVLPYEPYYKLQSSLLGLAVEQEPLPPGMALNLGLFAADAPATEQQLEALGAKVIGHDRSVFGPVLKVLAPENWTPLAQVPGVQIVEPAHTRVPANDLSRVTVGVSPDTTSGITNDYLGLTGQNVLVAVNDTGVDVTHPDFTASGTAAGGQSGAPRIFGLNPIDLVDTNGHGTHVAGIIAGNGAESYTLNTPPDSEPQGSVTNADYRGKAPLASIFSLNDSQYSDYQMQTNAAMIGALISNNSWDYGNGAAEYDLAAASYDAATRDAMPFTTGSQPVLFVFAAGNNGGGNNDGAGGNGDTILSPGTAKNVITVGALEQYRNITNIVTIVTDGITNQSEWWNKWTDSGSQVAYYSSRGNVGIGTEGNYGRFKPDVVSPGTFVVSTRSSQWNTNAYYNPTNDLGTTYTDQLVFTNSLTYYTVSVPSTAIGVTITVSPNQFTTVFPSDLPIYVKKTSYPKTNSNDFVTHKDGVAIPPDSGLAIAGIQSIQNSGFSFAVGNDTNATVFYDLTVQVLYTNNLGDLEIQLANMNEKMAPYYRYETGTSMAAADVSGVLALLEDYFTNTLSRTPSPALMKALLINGARSVGGNGLAITNTPNFQGWGLDNIQSTVPADGLTPFPSSPNTISAAGSSLFLDQNPTNALATGDSHTFIVNVDQTTDAIYYQVQATLVWTDPPGDPSAAIKLVNNLDLIITNLDTGDVYFGNDISSDVGFNEPWNTNGPPNLDSINNVENILIPSFTLTGNFSVTVVGRSVNVNAVTAQTNNAAGNFAPNIVQDYALVVSIGEGEVTNALTVTDGGIVSNPTGDQNLTVVTTTNSPLFDQFVGASSPLLGTNTLPLGANTEWGSNGVVTLGMTNQWHFYIVTNTGIQADYTNAAFIIFDAYDLSIPRMGVYQGANPGNATRPEADVDLYVSQDPSLTNLNPVAIANCLAGVGGSRVSLSQGGTEFVYYTNSVSVAAGSPSVYYLGVKSEDQMASEYALLPVFTDIPFSQLDQNGNQIVHGLLLPTYIPDGDNAHPGVTNIFALAVMPMVVEKVTVTNLNEHQNFGDLYGAVTFAGQFCVLNNHDGLGNTYGSTPKVYDDSRNPVAGTQHSDGPGNLVNFRTKSALGPWILGEMDNSLTMTGQVSKFDLVIQPHRDLTKPGVVVSVPPLGWFIDYVTVPAGYTNLTFAATNVSTPYTTPAIQMYEKFGNDPTFTDFDQMDWLTNCAVGTFPTGFDPGNTISVGPPLAMGQYFIGLYNPNNITAQNVYISATLGIDATINDVYNFNSGSGTVIPDDAVSGSTISVPNTVTQLVASVNVGLVVQSPRISDYTFTLVSPTGQRVLLMENRGGGTTNGAGSVFIYTNVLNSTATGGAGANTNYLSVPVTGITVPITYNFYTVPDRMTVYDSTNPAEFNTNGSFLLLDTGFTNNVPNGQGAQNTVPVTVNVVVPPGVPTITIIMNQDGNPFGNGGDAWTYTAGAPITNYEYLVFTDDTNLTTVPIKYAQPPYNFTEGSTNYLLSDFNLSTNGDYFSPTNIYDAYGGWTVPTNLVTYTTIETNGQFVVVTNIVQLTNNFVSIITDPSSALTGDSGGSNILALADGTITRTIATIPGQLYNVTFWYRGPGISGWWRGEGNANDSSDPENNYNNGTLVGRFNFPAGEVDQAFQFEDPGNTYQFAATNTYVQIPASTSLNVGAGGGLTIEGWINPTNLTRPQPLVEWLAHVPTNTAVTNVVIVQGPVLNPATGHYYYLLATTNWTTSELWAQELGGHLATIETANEENWVYDTFTAYGTLNRDLWIGYTNNGPNTAFGWSSGLTNITYTNWVAGLPFNVCNGDRYTYIASPTNAYPGLWMLADNLGRICGNPPTNPVYGVVEVTGIPTNGVQFWISGTNWTPGLTNSLQGCLYANLVDTNYVSHQIWSAPGLLHSNVYQHVAVTYNTNSGLAILYLNGTNVATTNLGVFMPKTDGDVLLGWDMSLYTNNYYGGRMDEMSIYSRALSDAEIYTIYYVSASTTNRTIGKFDPGITPAVGLAEASVSFGGTSNIIYGVNNKWEVNSFTFTAASNTMPLTISGLEPGILLDSFSVSDSPETNLYYLPEQALAALNGDVAGGNWTLQVWDNRAGAYVTNFNSLVNWQLSFVLESNAVISAALSPQTPVNTTVAPGQIVYYSVTVPTWADEATNILVSSSQPVDLLYFSPTNPPTGGNPADFELLTNVTTGIGSPVLFTNGTPPLLQGQTYYLGVRNNTGLTASVALEVDYDIVSLTNGVPFSGVLTNEYNTVRYFEFDVTTTNAYEATFQLLKLTGNADLVLSQGVPLPTLAGASYGSFNTGTADENIYLLTNSTPVPLSVGRWYLGVFKRDSGPIGYSVLAKELDLTNGAPAINLIYLTNGVPFNWTAGPGAALTNFFVFRGTNFISNGVTNYMGARFELFNLSGNGDLTVQTNNPPFAPPFFQSSQNPGQIPELIFIHTNNMLTNLAADWYLGVPNHETNLISFSIIAVIQTNLYFPAFPDAQGAGEGAQGAGHAGNTNSTVYHVTTINDTGPGSLRAAVGFTNCTVIFDVGGTITLGSPLVITNSYLTIAGQTAPGSGITVVGDMTTLANVHDVIIRDVRFRPGNVVTSPTVVWANGFEGGNYAQYYAGSYFAGGWYVASGDIQLLGPPFFTGAYQGSDYVDMNGDTPGVIYTNVSTVAGQSYTLDFAYTQNPDGRVSGYPTASVELLQNGNGLLTLTLNNTNNSWANLGWATTSVVFTATSPITQIQFAAQSAGAYGVLLDAVSLTANPTVVDTGDSLQFLNTSNIIADHISASWSAHNLVSVLNSSNVTVQWSIMADSLYYTNNPQGVGSYLREGGGTLSFHHNLYADNYSGSPRLGDNLTLDFVNNVIYNWGIRSGLTGGTNDLFDYSTNGCTNQLNYVCNYLIAGIDTADFATNNYNITNIAYFGGGTNALAANWIFQTNNFIDSDTNGLLNGADTGWNMFTNQYTRFGRAFPTPPVPVDEAFIAYERVLDFAGVNLFQRDAVDTNIVTNVRYQTGRLISVPAVSGKVAWWQAESNALDSSGNNNNGQLMNVPAGAGFGPGKVGTAFSLNVQTNFLHEFVLVTNVTPSMNVGTNNGFTIECWISPQNNSLQYIADYEKVLGGSGANIGVQLYTSGGSLFGVIVDTNGVSHSTNTANLITTNGMFKHVALTFDKNLGAATLYVAGLPQAQLTGLVGITPQTSYTNFLIGARTTGGTVANPRFPFSGGIDEMIIYNRALSATQISADASGSANTAYVSPPTFLDTDQDGIPDFWELTFTPTNVFVPSNNQDRDGDGYTDLEEYNNWLAVPHALTITNAPVAVDLQQLCGESGRLAFFVTNSIHGLVYLTNAVNYTNYIGSVTAVTNTTYFSNSFAIFTPTNSTAGGTNYNGYASFDLYVTNLDTAAYFGPVTVSVMVSAVPIAINPAVVINELTTGVATTNCNSGGSDFYHFTVDTNAVGALFELDAPSGPMTLALRYGLPLPSLSSHDYVTNQPAFPGNEQILVLTNSSPVPLAPGDWYMAAVNTSGSTVCYSAKATEYLSIVPPQFSFPTNTTVTNIIETVPFAMSCVATDLDTPPLALTFALVTGPFGGGLTVSNNGVINWTPTEAQGPSTNLVSVSVSNGAFIVTNTFTIIVEESNLPPVLPIIPNQLIIGTNTLIVTNTATDPDIPANALGYLLTTTVPGLNLPGITTNGIITWTPTLAQVESNYLFTTVVTDTNPWAVNAQSLSATNSFYVTVLPGLVNGQSNGFTLGTNDIIWFAIPVPTNAIYATNRLLFATLPVNIWFSTNLPPSITNAADVELLGNATNGSSVLSTNLATAPTNIVPGGVYFLGVQNTNNASVSGALEVDFALAYPFAVPSLPVIPDQIITVGDTLIVTNTATDANTNAVLVYTLSGSGAAAGAGISANGIITWTPDATQAPTNVVIITVVTDTNLNFSVTNSFNVLVLPSLLDNQPQTNILGANSIRWFTIKVPVNAIQATNILLFASAPVNLWFSTNVPPSITNAADFELLTNSIGGSQVIGTNTVPLLVPGSRYYLGVQNTNNFAVTNAVKVRFHLVTPVFSISSIVATNMAGSNGFLVTWYAPTNYQFHLQWTPALVPANWKNFNGVISFTSYIAATNSQFQYFDDGSQTGGFGPTRFYRLLLLNSPTNTAPFFLATPASRYQSPGVMLTVTNAAKDWDIPAQTLTYSATNSLLGTNNVVINPVTGILAWTPTPAQIGLTNIITTIVTDNGVPAKSATNAFTVIVGATPSFSSILVNASGVHFQWSAFTNEQFQIRWTTNLAPPVWTTFPVTNTSTTGIFNFVDTNTSFLMKFYELILLP